MDNIDGEPIKRSRGRPRTQITNMSGTIVQALDKGLILLIALTREGSITLSDLALKVGTPPSSAHRVLMTLQKHGFVEFDETRQEWAIGIEAFRVGNAYLERTNLVEMSQQVMRELMEETGETANLAIGSDGQVVFVSQVETHNPIRAFFRPGTRGHMHASGIGKALLADMSQQELEKTLQKTGLPEFTPKTLVSPEALFADLKKTAIRRWSFDDEERYMGMRCVAASIYDSTGKAVAGVSVSGPTIRFADMAVDEIGPRVRSAADEITHMIGGKIPGRIEF